MSFSSNVCITHTEKNRISFRIYQSYYQRIYQIAKQAICHIAAKKVAYTTYHNIHTTTKQYTLSPLNSPLLLQNLL